MFSEKDPIIRLNKKTVLVLHWSDSYRCCQLYNPIQAESQQNTAEKPSNSFPTGSAGLYGVQSAELHNLFMNQVSVKTLLHTSNLNLFDSVVRKQKVLGFPTMRRIIFVGEPPSWNSFICRTAGLRVGSATKRPRSNKLLHQEKKAQCFSENLISVCLKICATFLIVHCCITLK